MPSRTSMTDFGPTQPIDVPRPPLSLRTASLFRNSTELEFLYRPQIHAERDKELISILPDYLTEELTFERGVASKFYVRVVNKLDEKIQIEEDEETEE